MKAISLQSGSNGNCIFVEAAGHRLLLDAGISGIQAERRLAAHGIDIRTVDALLISHDHRDHVRCAGVYQRKYGLPVWCTNKTLHAAQAYCNLGKMADVRHFQSGRTLRFGELSVETIPTPHDAADGVGFVLDDGCRRMGVLTDLGHVFDGLAEVVASLDAVILESNYDADMLADGPYPAFLKRRIRGPHGHLSNVEAAELIRSSANGRLQWLCLAHLSRENNNPDLALRTHRDLLDQRLPVKIAGRDEPTGVLAVLVASPS